MKIEPKIKYVLFTDQNNKWRVQVGLKTVLPFVFMLMRCSYPDLVNVINNRPSFLKVNVN